jgi:hypothetical protein
MFLCADWVKPNLRFHPKTNSKSENLKHENQCYVWIIRTKTDRKTYVSSVKNQRLRADYCTKTDRKNEFLSLKMQVLRADFQSETDRNASFFKHKLYKNSNCCRIFTN